MKKILFIVLDGLGDEPIPKLGGKTPLEAAHTPNLDFLVQRGICGLAIPKYQGDLPTSEEGHFCLFGYDPKYYKVKRGIFTALGADMGVKEGDVALRGNFSTVDENLNMIDRRAGRIADTEDFIKTLDGMKIDGVKFFMKNAGEYRVGIVMRGKGLSVNISDGDQFYGKMENRPAKIRPLEKTKEAIFTAQVLNKFLERSYEILKIHPKNIKRKNQGLLPANYILVRGASGIIKAPSFKEKYGLKAACISGKLLYKQVAKILGMTLLKVQGATGLPNTNLKAKFLAAKKALKKYDFVFLHIKATDSLAEDGKFLEKKEFIERIDKNLKEIINLKDALIVVTCDHSTCSLLKRHCAKPCPVLIYGAGKDGAKKFSEKECRKGKLGRVNQLELMSKILGVTL